MDIQQYISSGIIETYVLGMATDEEARELELLCAQYPELDAAVLSYQMDMERYVSMNAIEPPEGMKEQIWAAIQNEETPVVKVTPVSTATSSNTISFNQHQKSGAFSKMAVAAAVAIIVVSIGMNAYLWNKTKESEQEVAAAKSDQQKMLDANKTYQQQLAQVHDDMQLLLNPSVKSMVLAGVGNHTGVNAMLLWDTKSKEVYLSLKDMPPPPNGKQYQLWAIVDGKPVDAGVYALDSKEAMQKMKVIPSAQMFAITIENAGGSPTPTLDQMVVAGKV